MLALPVDVAATLASRGHSALSVSPDLLCGSTAAASRCCRAGVLRAQRAQREPWLAVLRRPSYVHFLLAWPQDALEVVQRVLLDIEQFEDEMTRQQYRVSSGSSLLDWLGLGAEGEQ